MYGGFFITLITLTRYEGYVILLSSSLTVFIGCILIYGIKQKNKIEGTIIMFLTLASMGIILWSLYSLVIFGDIIYWLHLYTGKAQLIQTNPIPLDSETATQTTKKFRTLFSSFLTYGWSATLMTGIPIMALGLLSYILFVAANLNNIIKKRFEIKYLAFILISASLAVFLVVGYRIGIIPGIDTPPMRISTLLSKYYNQIGNTNIRYGIFAVPLIAIPIGYFSSKNRIFAAICILVIATQLVLGFYSNLFLQYRLDKRWNYSNIESASWFKKNYTGGKILISAYRQEPFIFQSELPYENFIYEGSQKYWLQSLRKPSKYASWVIYDTALKRDSIKEFLEDPEQLTRYYNLVYKKKTFVIYKIKTKPDIVMGN